MAGGCGTTRDVRKIERIQITGCGEGWEGWKRTTGLVPSGRATEMEKTKERWRGSREARRTGVR